jgi:glycosyltransferase involved in cell wall biosynthesis
LAGVPVIVHTVHGWSFHNHMAPRVRNTYIYLEKLAARFTDAMVVVAQPDIEKGLRQGIGRRDQYRLIRSAIPLDEFDPGLADRARARQTLGLPLAAPVLGNIGRFSAQKNPLEWVQVAGRVAQALPECRFLLVGDGPLRTQVEARLEAEDLKEKVVLPGLRRDVPEMLSAIDVFLLTSLWEGLPRVIPQALAMRVPVVANRIDGSAEAITDGGNGYLCQAGDINCLANCCIELLQNPVLREEMGAKGRMFAIKEFDLQFMVTQIASMYEELLKSKGI